jgi:peptidoglycan hydrolase-like protein with peptidoglycan-binding domain
MDTVPALDLEGIRQVQQALQDKGFDPGPVDGVLGSRTKEAVLQFQNRYGIDSNGKVDNQTLFTLGKLGLAGSSARMPDPGQ